jgi:hypothetical protein
LPETVEVYRRGHSEFRLERKTFASLEGPADAMAMVNLTSEQQAMFMHAAPRAFVSVPGGWGRLGRTDVLLGFVQEAMLESSLAAACNVAPKSARCQLWQTSRPSQPVIISSVTTLKPMRMLGPNVVVMATSIASRPLAISTRPIRGTLLRASKVYQRPPR